MPGHGRVICSAVALAAALLLTGCEPAAPRNPPTSAPVTGAAGGAPATVRQIDAVLGELVVFVQTGKSPLDAAFQQQDLPLLRAAADELRVPLRVIDARQGAPAEITLTPSVAFQNHRGRSLYLGRWSTLDRVRTFVRAARRSPQSLESQRREELPVWRNGRATIGAPLKLAGLSGARPDGHDDAAFETESLRAVHAGLQRFQLTATAEFQRSDRLFYMDFYPWRSDDGQLYLTVKLFSQFHCHVPVFSNEKTPLIGPWAQRERLFREGAALLERAVVEQLAESRIGDGFDPLADSIAKRSWEELGLSLPAAPLAGQSSADTAPIEWPVRWGVAAANADGSPRLSFRFAAPLDSYAGEVRSVSGTVELGPNGALTGMRGEFIADPASITMGEADLDRELLGSDMLDVKRHPQSRFVMQSISGDTRPLAVGEVRELRLAGEFELKGRRVPLECRALLEPMVDEAGAVRLSLQAGWSLDISAFGLEGPPGPKQSQNQMLFQLLVEFAPGS